MALTLVNQPNDYDSAYRPVKLTLDTSVSELDAIDFNLVDNVTSQSLASKYQRANFADADTFTADFSLQIQDNLRNDIENLTVGGTVIQAANMIKQFRIDATEKILVSGQYTDGDTYTGNGIYIVNSTLEVGENSLVTQGYYTTTSGTLTLTNKPSFQTRVSESEYIAIYNNGENVKATITVTDNAGATTTGVINSLATGTQVTYFGTGYSNINAYTLSTGTQPLLDENSVSYTVRFETLTTGTIFEQIEVTIDRSTCATAIRFHFENVFGTIDSFTMKGYEEKRIKPQGQLAQKVVSDFTSSESYGRFKSNNKKLTIYNAGTQTLSETERIWLEEMLSSSNVWVQSGNNYLPITITENDFRISSNKFGQEIFIIELEYQFANNLRRQKN